MGWALGLRSRISVAWHMRSGEEQSVQRPSTAQGVLSFRRLALRGQETFLMRSMAASRVSASLFSPTIM